jgi:hypothetical protein
MGQGQLLEPGETMEIYEALKTAMEALRAQKLMYREEFKLTASKVEQEWVFWFVFLPETIGMDVTAIVDADGKVKTSVGF